MTQNHVHEKTTSEVIKIRKDSQEITTKNQWDSCTTWDAEETNQYSQPQAAPEVT
jgi:hypothetical protein